MNPSFPHLGLGIGWRPELALLIQRRCDLHFIELVAEDFYLYPSLPRPIEELLDKGVVGVPHGISLSLGGAELPDHGRLKNLSQLVKRLNAPFVSEHIAFVRAGGLETGHLLPVPRTKAALAVVVDNVRMAQDALPVPLVLENIASLFEWPNPEMDETEFLSAVLEQTDAMLLLDLANLHANALNRGFDPVQFLKKIPLDRLAYVHMAGGVQRDGFYHDTHAHQVPASLLELFSMLCTMTKVPGVMLERDDQFPDDTLLNMELDRLKQTWVLLDPPGKAKAPHLRMPYPPAHALAN